MKVIRNIIIGFGVCAAIVAAVAVVAHNKIEKHWDEKDHLGLGMMHVLTDRHITHKLELSSEQKLQLMTIRESKKALLDSLRTQQEMTDMALLECLRTPPIDTANVTQLEANLLGFEKRELDIRIETAESFLAILTPAQRNTLDGIIAKLVEQRADRAKHEMEEDKENEHEDK